MSLDRDMGAIYRSLEGNAAADEYGRRHGIKSAAILTITDDETAALVAEHLAERVRGKVVVEIGGGIGLLALHLSQYVERVFVIEAEPAWTMLALAYFYAKKPKNVTFIFGAADEMAGQIKADVSYFCTHSAANEMSRLGAMFAPTVIDVYGEIVPLLSPELAALGPARAMEKQTSTAVEEKHKENP